MKALLVLAFAWTMGVGATSDRPPLGLDMYLPAPAANPLTPETIARGRQLFFDKRLSRDRTLSCGSCHEPKRAFSDGRPIARGVGGAEGTRHASSLINRGYGESGFWDGRAGPLEEQVLEPILNPRELGLTESELTHRTGLTVTEVTAALASYVRTIRSGDSRFDRYAAGKTSALTALEQEGLRVFRSKGNCLSCHAGPNFTDERFHNTGVAWRDGRLHDEGRFAVSELERDRGAFKTPTLRDVARTAPYMHDGSLGTLEDVVEFYANGGRQNQHLDPFIRPLELAPRDKEALAAFLRSLNGRIREGRR